LLLAAEELRFDIPAYCFMPDHLHVLAEGRSTDSDLARFIARFKQNAGFWHSQAGRGRLWQDGYYDRILRDDEQTIVVARYILDNPVRAGLVARFDEYPHSGSTKYTMSELADAIQSLR
jgi:putative transposase